MFLLKTLKKIKLTIISFNKSYIMHWHDLCYDPGHLEEGTYKFSQSLNGMILNTCIQIGLLIP